jgi:ribosomal protein S18 acetylase RimI-like enzyme
MDEFELSLNDPPGAQDRDFLDEKITEYNYRATGYTDGRILSISIKQAGETIAGIFGWTWGGCSEIEFLWVNEAFRGQGVGKRLLEAAEEEARRRGCRDLVLDTHSFQAPGFYLKCGYEVIAEVENHPQGYKKIYLRKVL